jgi:hypothetical protein
MSIYDDTVRKRDKMRSKGMTEDDIVDILGEEPPAPAPAPAAAPALDSGNSNKRKANEMDLPAPQPIKVKKRIVLTSSLPAETIAAPDPAPPLAKNDDELAMLPAVELVGSAENFVRAAPQQGEESEYGGSDSESGNDTPVAVKELGPPPMMPEPLDLINGDGPNVRRILRQFGSADPPDFGSPFQVRQENGHLVNALHEYFHSTALGCYFDLDYGYWDAVLRHWDRRIIILRSRPPQVAKLENGPVPSFWLRFTELDNAVSAVVAVEGPTLNTVGESYAAFTILLGAVALVARRKGLMKFAFALDPTYQPQVVRKYDVRNKRYSTEYEADTSYLGPFYAVVNPAIVDDEDIDSEANAEKLQAAENRLHQVKRRTAQTIASADADASVLLEMEPIIKSGLTLENYLWIKDAAEKARILESVTAHARGEVEEKRLNAAIANKDAAEMKRLKAIVRARASLEEAKQDVEDAKADMEESNDDFADYDANLKATIVGFDYERDYFHGHLVQVRPDVVGENAEDDDMAPTFKFQPPPPEAGKDNSKTVDTTAFFQFLRSLSRDRNPERWAAIVEDTIVALEGAPNPCPVSSDGEREIIDIFFENDEVLPEVLKPGEVQTEFGPDEALSANESSDELSDETEDDVELDETSAGPMVPRAQSRPWPRHNYPSPEILDAIPSPQPYPPLKPFPANARNAPIRPYQPPAAAAYQAGGDARQRRTRRRYHRQRRHTRRAAGRRCRCRH